MLRRALSALGGLLFVRALSKILPPSRPRALPAEGDHTGKSFQQKPERLVQLVALGVAGLGSGFFAWFLTPRPAPLTSPSAISVEWFDELSHAYVTVNAGIAVGEPSANQYAGVVILNLISFQADSPPSGPLSMRISGLSHASCSEAANCEVASDRVQISPRWSPGACMIKSSTSSSPCFQASVSVNIQTKFPFAYTVNSSEAYGVLPRSRAMNTAPINVRECILLESRYSMRDGPFSAFTDRRVVVNEGVEYTERCWDFEGNAPGDRFEAVDYGRRNQDSTSLFLAGALAGVSGGAAVSLLQELLRRSDQRRR